MPDYKCCIIYHHNVRLTNKLTIKSCVYQEGKLLRHYGTITGKKHETAQQYQSLLYLCPLVVVAGFFLVLSFQKMAILKDLSPRCVSLKPLLLEAQPILGEAAAAILLP